MPYEDRRESREYREGGMSVKARLRAKARKKNRKSKKRGFSLLIFLAAYSTSES